MERPTDPGVLTDKEYWEAAWRRKGHLRQDLRRYDRFRIARLLDACLPRGHRVALEVGAGNSIWLPYMAQTFGYTVVGLDYSRLGCELLRANLVRVSTPSLVIQGDLFHDCFHPASFDVVFSYGLVEHFVEYKAILERFTSWLRPGGMLITLVPNKRRIFRHVERWLAPDAFDSHLLLTPADLLRAYQAIGLEDIRAHYFGSFTTWAYTSRSRGLVRLSLRMAARVLSGSAQTLLRALRLEPETRAFSPLIAATGRTSSLPT